MIWTTRSLRRLEMRGVYGFLFLLVLGTAGAAEKPQTPAQRMLERMRNLVGEWEGTLEWTGARTGTGPLKASYTLTGYGSAIVENLISPESPIPSMTSVYHLDGSDLRMTHFCGAQNQPRLKATEIDEARGVVKFSFVDATGLTEHPGHVAAFEMRFLPDDRLELRFTFESGGKTSLERI